jgi:hypothetical protein
MIESEITVGILYLKPAFPREHPLHWLSHCAMTEMLPKKISIPLKKLVDRLNLEYKDDLIIPIDYRIIPGCVSKPEKIEEIVERIYVEFVSMFEDLGIENPKIRVCYTISDIPEKSIMGKKSAHYIGSYPAMIRLGHGLDQSSVDGIHRM